MPIPAGRPVALLLLCAQMSACATWQRPHTGVAPAQHVAAAEPPRVRILTSSGDRLEIVGPTVVGDSIVGTTGGRQPHPRAVAIADVKEIRVRRVSAAATTAAVVGGLALSAAIAIGIFAATWDGPLSGWGN